MTHGDKRRLFTHNVAMLILYAETLGYEMAIDNTTGPTPAGDRSLHPHGLAVDMNLYKVGADGRRTYLRSTSAHAPLGEFWKSLHPLNRWGGDFPNPDGNHYSITHWGLA